MSEMVERVAEAIWQIEMKEGEGVARFPHEYWTHAARVAIEVMREPTQAMCKAPTWDDHVGTGDTRAIWQEMITEALK